MNEIEIFRNNLCRIRHEVGLSQEMLAIRANISQAQLFALEKGQYEPKLGTLNALAKALGVTIDHLTSETPLPPVPQTAIEAAIECSEGRIVPFGKSQKKR